MNSQYPNQLGQQSAQQPMPSPFGNPAQPQQTHTQQLYRAQPHQQQAPAPQPAAPAQVAKPAEPVQASAPKPQPAPAPQVPQTPQEPAKELKDEVTLEQSSELIDGDQNKEKETDEFDSATPKEQVPDLEPYNLEKILISVPLTDFESLLRYRGKTEGRTEAEQADIEANQSSDWSVLTRALRTFTAATDSFQDSLKTVKDTSKLTDHIDTVNDKGKAVTLSDKAANPYHKFQGQKEVDLSGSYGSFVVASLTGGLHRVYLWNSGFYLNIKSLPLAEIARYIRNVDSSNYEYGKTFGGWYYMFADLEINKYIIENLLPIAIGGSNYQNYRDMDKLMEVISIQDYPVILATIASVMYPNGTDINLCCGNDGCEHIETVHADLSKLHLINAELVTDDMIKHMASTSKWVTDQDIANYKKMLNLDREIKFEYTDEMGINKKFTVVLHQNSISELVKAGEEFNERLAMTSSIRSIDEVQDYLGYNLYRGFKAWISKISFTTSTDEHQTTFSVTNNLDNVDAIDSLLDEFRLYSSEFGTLVREYIMSTRISHIAHFYPKCPHCGKEPVNSYHGYIAFDVAQIFFILAQLKLLTIKA